MKPEACGLRLASSCLRLSLCLGFLLAACSQVRQLTPADSLSDEEKLDYLALAALAPDAAQQYATAGSARNRADFLQWFWRNTPALPGTPASSLLPSPSAFYHRRAREARSYFGATDLLNDDRVLVYVRHGPARREQYDPRVVETETSRVFVNPAEIWSYDSLGRQFDFVKTGTAYKIVGDSRYGPGAVMPALEPVDLGEPPPAFAADARPLGLEFSLGRLGQRGNSVEVELAFGIPLDTIAAVFPAGARPLVNVTLDLVPRANGAALTRSSWLSCPLPLDTSTTDMAVGRELLRLPADIYTATVTAVTRDGKAASRRTQELNLVDYARRNQPASDVLFYSLVDSTPQSPQFKRSDWARVVPLVVPRVRSGGSFCVLYEIYHIGQDQAGNHRAEVSYELIQRETREKAVLPVRRRFLTSPGTTAVATERVHTMDLKPGPYLLTSRVRDLADASYPADHASVTAAFEILPRR
jgi:hypothetical protein